ncbi:MAG: hypothetical protein JL55_14930 [Pseudomonas sp. BICA1-14]|nr:MAG: hypothetical protein JL55_14930 [[Pseudomonas] sp. BICA1-14]
MIQRFSNNVFTLTFTRQISSERISKASRIKVNWHSRTLANYFQHFLYTIHYLPDRIAWRVKAINTKLLHKI